MSRNINVSTIILAAGFSSRMGELKALLDIGGKHAILHLINESIKAGIRDIVVVLGFKNEEILRCINDKKIKCVVNEYYVRGMYSSVQKGVMEIDPNSKGFMIMPVDIPLIKANTIRELATFFIENNYDIISPFFNNIKGHPPVLSRKCIKSILNDEPAGGLQNIINSKEWSTYNFNTLDEGTLYEMDTKDQYFKLLEYYKKAYIPNDRERNEIIKRCRVPEDTIMHMNAVADAAFRIGQALTDCGEDLDLELLYAAAVLHDIKRDNKNHAKISHDFLKKLGYNKISDIVLEHMDIVDISDDIVSEKEILYLADKMVKNNKVVGICCRFEEAFKNPDIEIIKKVNIRFHNALKIMNKVEKITGKPIYDIVLMEEKGD